MAENLSSLYCWLTKDFLKTTLENVANEREKIEIDRFSVKGAIEDGYNYSCKILSVRIECSIISDGFKKPDNFNCIMKVPLEGEVYEKIAKSGMEREIRVYDELIPKLESIFGDDDDESGSFSRSCSSLFAKSFPNDAPSVLILEDLCVNHGFVMSNFKPGYKRFDYDHCLLAFKSLAKFHAGSVVLHELEPKFVEEIGDELFFRKSEKNSIEMLFMINFKNVAEEFKNHKELNKYVDWLNKNYDIGFDKLIDSVERKDHEFNVLNHGDFRLWNVLIKYDGYRPTDFKLIDFQTCRYTSPAFDFLYFMEGGSVEENVRDDKFDQILTHYVTELNDYLKHYGSEKRLDENDFRRTIIERSFIRILMTVSVLCINVAEYENKLEVWKIDDFSNIDTAEVKKNPFSNFVKSELFIKIISKRLDQFVKSGFLDLNEI